MLSYKIWIAIIVIYNYWQINFCRKASDPLTWHVVPLKQCKSYDRIDDVSIRDVQVVLNVAPRTKLGCG